MEKRITYKKISNKEGSELVSEIFSELLKSKEGFYLFGKYLNSVFSGVDMSNFSKIENIYGKHLVKTNKGEVNMMIDKDLEKKLDSILESSEDDTVIVVYGPAESGKSTLLNNLNKKTGIQKLSNRVIDDCLIKNFSNGSFGKKGIILDEAERFIERHKGKKIKGGKYILSIQAPLEDTDMAHAAKTFSDIRSIFGKKRVKMFIL
ncbi:hypothetical protein E1N66_22820 [Pantoea allii]|nr:hypothetical protein [Pantoea allii]THB82090.1 hypothetical protein E1N66_22820 [Pantoea allii]